MKLQSLHITSFRNIESLSFDFEKSISLFVGKNGQGKTNILEAIHMISRTYSFRTKNHREIIAWDNDWFRISAKFNDPTTDFEHEIAMTSQVERILKKQIKLDGVDTTQGTIMGMIPSVLFLPNELDLLSGEPAMRRKMLDSALMQTDKEYLRDLADLQSTLKSRNKLLKDIRDGYSKRDELPFWNEKMIELNERIGLKRLVYIEHLAELLENTYNNISKTSNKIQINYEPTQNLAEHFKFNIDKEIILARTMKGPHREDFEILIDRQPFKTFGSRGEHRTIILSLKLAELEYLKIKTKKSPILLLDDVMSELDSERQTNLLENLSGIQVFISTTDDNLFPHIDDLTTFHIENGRIHKQS